MPVDRSKLPPIPELDAVVITDLYTLSHCAADGCGAVWIGPRQLARLQSNPDGFIVLCYIHAVYWQVASTGSFDPDTDVTQLGGGYPAEGRPRIT
jgi:hypothetical protein